MNEPVGLLIGAARRRLKQAATARLRDTGLTPLQFWALVNIDERNGPSLRELAERLRLDAPATTRAVSGLLQRKLARAEGDRSDRRRLRLHLAPAGKARMPRLRALAAELRGATVHGLTRNEQEMLRALLRKVIASLDAMVKLAVILAVAAAACVPFAEQRIDGDVAPSPAAQLHERPPPPPPPAQPAAEALAALAAKGGTVSLAQLIELALKNSPDTRAAWADARAAAAAVGSKRAAWMPELDGTAGWYVNHTVFSPTITTDYKDWSAGVQLSWLMLDLGTRSADIDEARALLAAANLNHDAAVQDLILRVEQAYTQYQGAKALLAAAKASVGEAQTAYEAAEQRRSTGLATVADVLQAKTALSQAQLNFQTLDGQVQALRGAVATAVGVPATVPVDAEDLPAMNVEVQLARIDDLIAQAEKERPDLARARAQALAAGSHADSVRWRGWPQLTLNAGATEFAFIARGYPTGNSYTASVVLKMPLFTGFKDSYDAAQAAEQARAAQARAESVEQQAILSVWSSYQGVRTSVQRVRTARDLLSSAQESEQVAQGRYKEGVGSILDVLTAQSALASARAQEVQARADWLLAVASLAHDTGSLGPPPGATK